MYFSSIRIPLSELHHTLQWTVTISFYMDKVLNFITLMNLWTDSERKWGLEPESNSEIEGIHLHHKDMSN